LPPAALVHVGDGGGLSRRAAMAARLRARARARLPLSVLRRLHARLGELRGVTALSVEARDGEARAGWLDTRHGRFRVPAFMPVGTHATVNAVHPDELRASAVESLLRTAYHLPLRPRVHVSQRA